MLSVGFGLVLSVNQDCNTVNSNIVVVIVVVAAAVVAYTN